MVEEAAKRVFFDKLFGKWSLPAAIHQIILGILIVLPQLGIATYESSFFRALLFWVAMNLMATPFVLRRRFVTPSIATPKCHYCGSSMSAVKLKCESCGAVSEALEKT